ncbi:exosortase-associated protein EpsI, V-type [Novosphingobium sp. M1R2S20]|uniref:Exosortase-associated protein EpsI, V-type n=1 Tax=Novosphingobium rhizovicinum TaxID=3228928 RepID=A0ABV3R9A0_9SPHN
MRENRRSIYASDPSLTRRELILGSLILGTAAVSFARLPRTPVIGLAEGNSQDVLPKVVGEWVEIPSAEDIVVPPEDERKAAAIYDEQVMRTYQNGKSQQIMLLVAYARSQSSMLMVHRPESCYPGSGFTIISNDVVEIPIVPGLSVSGRFLTTKLDSRTEQVLYWTRFGNETPVDWDDQRWTIATQALKGKIPDGALVRMSIISPNISESLTILQSFAADLVKESGSNGQGLLVGPANRGIGTA